MLGQLDKDYDDTMEIMTLGSSKYIVIMNKYKQHISSESSKRIE